MRNRATEGTKISTSPSMTKNAVRIRRRAERLFGSTVWAVSAEPREKADEALRAGVVARVVAREAWLDEAKRVARGIASKSPVSVRLAKESIDRAFDVPLTAGLELERRAFYLARASDDATEGLTAFVEKRRPDFKGR